MEKNLDLNELADLIKSRIQAHAEKNNISFEEALKKANLSIDGKVTKLYNVESDEEKT